MPVRFGANVVSGVCSTTMNVPHKFIDHTSKTARVLDLLKRPGGATLKEIMKATTWQSHSVRGFLSGTLRKKLGLRIDSFKGKNNERTCRVPGR